MPEDWAERGGTVYVTYGLHAQGSPGRSSPAIVAGLVRHLQARPAGQRALLSLDEAPAVGVPGLSHYLSTLGGSGSGVTCVVYTQSVPALAAVYGKDETRSIVGNCWMQIWHRPQDVESADELSRIFGERCEVVWNPSSGTSQNHSQAPPPCIPSNYSSGASSGASLGTRYRPAMNVAEVMALAKHEVLVLALGKRARLYSSWAVHQNGFRNMPPPPVTDPGLQYGRGSPSAAGGDAASSHPAW